MDIILKIALFGITVTILTVLLKGMKSQIADITMIAGSIILLTYIINIAGGTLDTIKKMFDSSRMESETIKSVFKIISIAYIAEFSSSLCKDMGETSMATKIEAAGRLLILVTAIPWAVSLIEAVQSITV